jgi:hypothetical protein
MVVGTNLETCIQKASTMKPINDLAIHDMLVRFRTELASLYPMTEENSEPVDTRYCFTIGLLLGTIEEGLRSVREDRPIRLNDMGFKQAVINHTGALQSQENAREGNEE